VDQIIEDQGPQFAMMFDSEEGRGMILNELVAGHLFALSGRKQGLDKTPEYKSALDNFEMNFLARAAAEEVIKDVTASDEDCKKFYDENKEEFAVPEQIHAKHILIADDETSADKIALIQGELEKGVAFEDLATEHSICPSSQQGGDLGTFGRNQMVPAFEEAAFALKEAGDVSEPVKSDFGWHIIKLEEKVPPSLVPFDEAKPQIEQYLSGEKKAKKYQETLDALKEEYKVEILN